jgi:hypothetical protein
VNDDDHLIKKRSSFTLKFRGGHVSQKNLEKQLKKWREERARKASSQAPADRRTLRVNGQDVVVIKRGRSKLNSVQ